MKNRGEIENDSLIRFDFLIFPRGLGANAFGLVFIISSVLILFLIDPFNSWQQLM